MTLLRLDLDTLNNLLAVLDDAVVHRGDADLAGVVRLAQRETEKVAEQLEALVGEARG